MAQDDGVRVLLVISLLAGMAAAETGPNLILEPRRPQEGPSLRLAVEQYLGGRTDDGAEFDLRWWSAAARWSPGGARGPVLGGAADYLDVDSPDPRLPARLSDQSVAAGMDLGEWLGWSFRGLAGFGFAGDRPFSDGDAWYARADLAATREVRRGTSWTVLLSYDGNRAIFPDVPLPAVSYQRFVRPGLFFSLGLPFSIVKWEFAPGWTLEARGLLPVSGNLEVARRITDAWDVYGGYEDRTAAFHVDGASRTRRVFFRQRMVEVGVRYRPSDSVELTLAGGYAFDRKFETGWDVRDADTLVYLDDAAYVRLAARFGF